MESDVRVDEPDTASAPDRPFAGDEPELGDAQARSAALTGAVRRLARRLGLGPLELSALRVWGLSRVGILLITWAVAWTSQPPAAKHPRGWGTLWQRWDWLRYHGIAAHGYSLRSRHGASIAFFPGYPGVLYVVHLVVRSWVYCGLLISLIAGAVACVALARIIDLELFGRGPGRTEGVISPQRRTAVRDGVTLFVCAPAAVFLAVGYTESLFLAFALTGWLAARHGRWLSAGLLLAGAATTRVNGLFVLVAVGVLFMQSRPSGRGWLRGAWLAIPVVPVAAYMVYLHQLTGSWNAWQHAEQVGWNRHFTDPLRALHNTLQYAFGHRLPAATAWEYQVEILAVAVGLALFGRLLWRRRWAESVYIALSVGSLATSHVYLSVPREMLDWWPLWAAFGVWCVRRQWVKSVYLTVSLPMMFTIACLFFTNRWAG